MPGQQRQDAVALDKPLSIAMIDLLGSLKQSLAIADELRLPMVGVHLDQAIHALTRQGIVSIAERQVVDGSCLN